MSPSEEAAKLSALVGKLGAQIDRTIEAGELAEVPEDDLGKLMSGAVRLYAARVEESEAKAPRVINETVSTTEAMVVACALLRAHHLNPFDLALWFSRTAAIEGRERAGS